MTSKVVLNSRPGYAVVPGNAAIPLRIGAILADQQWQQVSVLDSTPCAVDLFFGTAAALAAVAAPFVPKIAAVSVRAANPGCDAQIAAGDSDEAVHALLDLWRPTPDAARFAELALGFGDAAVRPIVAGLSQQLQEAVGTLDAGRFGNAHRIAGLAGTLGFARVSKAWLPLDLGDVSDLATARREARLAIAAIERWLAR